MSAEHQTRNIKTSRKSDQLPYLSYVCRGYAQHEPYVQYDPGKIIAHDEEPQHSARNR